MIFLKIWQGEEMFPISGHMNLNTKPASTDQPMPLGAQGWKNQCNHSFLCCGGESLLSTGA